MTEKVVSLKKKVNLDMSSITPFLGIIFTFILFAILTGGTSLSASNLEVIVNQAFVFALMGVGGMFVFAHGGLDFSIGSCMGMCSYIISLFILNGYSSIWALIASVAFGALSGFLVGAASEFLGLTPFIASLCFSYIWRGVVQVILGYNNYPMPGEFCATYNNWILKVVVLVVVFVVGIFLFNRTKLGKYQKAIGGNQVVAQLSGVATKRYVILSHMIFGICVGLASIFSVARAAQVYPASGQGYDMDVLVACVLGGMPLSGGNSCRMVSVLIGAVTVAALDNGLTLVGVDPNLVDGITGIIFIIVVALSYKRSRGQIIK